ncbi:MAG: trans-aconitate 2-methyltransferase, partial [Gammaproteobacteria bacterium]|nr:trans-aconitate 2-methyltransferase [Gammaproteobacteria bacterium]
MLDWNPTLYRRYEDERTRPARELLARVPLSNVGLAIDLGCGPGNSTELLAERFEGAEIVGVDNSEAMLASARERLPQCRFDFGDIASWVPSRPPDLIYANAALQWVPQHEELIPRLFASLAPGGVLAIQMPDNRGEPTHRLMREVAAEVPWADAIGDADALRTRLLSPADYYDLLAPAAAKVDVWHTIYQHPMASAAAIVEWVRGTGLKPFVDRLSDDLAAGFLAEYENRVDKAYAKR